MHLFYIFVRDIVLYNRLALYLFIDNNWFGWFVINILKLVHLNCCILHICRSEGIFLSFYINRKSSITFLAHLILRFMRAIDVTFCPLLLSVTFSHFTSSWPWSYGSWIYNYLCNQCLSPLMLWVRISIRARCTTLCDKVCQ